MTPKSTSNVIDDVSLDIAPGFCCAVELGNVKENAARIIAMGKMIQQGRT